MRSLRRIQRVVLYVVGAAIVGWLASFAAVYVWSTKDDTSPADAIVVLGAAQYAGRPSPVLRSRLHHARDLWKQGVAPVLILTGGRGDGDTLSEAEVSRRYLRRQGVPESALLLEGQGRSTEESMAAVATIMSERQLKTAVVVSDPFHMLRVELLARMNGMKVHSSPTRTSPISASQNRALTYLALEAIKVPFTVVLSLVKS